MNKDIHQLLNSDETTTIETLNNLTAAQAAEAKEALVLLWQLHLDETIQQKAFTLLEPLLDAQEQTNIPTTFEVFRSILEYFPWMGDYQALQQTNFQKFKEGKAPYEGLLVMSKNFVESYLDLGRKLYMMFDLPEEAEVCFEGIVKYDAQNDEALYALGRLAEYYNKSEEAATFYKRCLDANAQHVYGSLQLGMLKANVFEDYRGAIRHYELVAELEPFMTENHVRMAEANYALGDVKRAKQMIEVALGINEYQDEALNLLGQIQWHYDDDVDAAMETFQKGLDHKVHGDSGLLLASLGQLHCKHFGEPDKGRVYYEKSLKAKPKQPKTVRALIVLLEEVYQDYGAMASCYESYLQVEKNDVDIYVDYASFLIKYMHDYEFAKIQLQEALAVEDNHEGALKVLDQISDYVDEEEEDDDDYDDDDDDDFVGGGAAGDN